jgi:hypothetical protein
MTNGHSLPMLFLAIVDMCNAGDAVSRPPIQFSLEEFDD